MKIARIIPSGRMERLTFLSIALLSASLLLVSLILIVNSARSYTQAQESSRVTATMDSMLSASLDLMFVRGRLNVVLSRKETISDEASSFLAERFLKADNSIHLGLASLDLIYPELATRLRSRYFELVALKDKGLLEAQKPFLERDQAVRLAWFTQASAYIEDLGNELSFFALKNNQEHYAFNYQRLLVLAVGYRNYFGTKASHVTSLMEQGAVPSLDELIPIMILDGKQEETWRNLELYALSTENAHVNETVKLVEGLCFGSYRTNLLASQQALSNGTPLPIDPKVLAVQSVEALDSINTLLGTVFDEAMLYSHQLAQKALQGLAIGALILLWSIAIVVLTPLLLRRKVFGPIDEVMTKLRAACQLSSDELAADDEILVLAKAADSLIIKVTEANRKNVEMRMKADTDSLTKLLNRRAFLEACSHRIDEASISGKKWALVILDLDHFKKVNDSFGHTAGDKALKHFASILTSGLRSSDLACRYGGEEFLAFLDNAGEDIALSIVERMRLNLEHSSFDYEGNSIALRVSAGLFSTSGGDNLSNAVLKSDEALYKAKAAGRNCTVVWTPESHPSSL